MPLSRAELQRAYRERKKATDGELYLAKERARQKRYYKPVASLTKSEIKKRNKEINERVRKHRRIKRLEQAQLNVQDDDTIESSSGYGSQEPFNNRLIVRIPNRQNGPRMRLSKEMKKVKERLKDVTKENIEIRRKLKSAQRKLQRRAAVNRGPDTPRRSTENLIRAVKGDKKQAHKARKQLLIGQVLVHEIKHSQKRHNLKKDTIIATVAGEITKKYRLMSTLSDNLHFSRKKMSNVIKKGINFAKLRRRRTIAKYRKSVMSFFEREDNSRIQPGKRDITRIDSEKVQTRILTDYLKNLYEKYRAEYPESKLSFSTFCRMRPKNFLLTSCLSRNVCLCTKHQNIALKLQMLRKEGVDVSQNPETFIESGKEVQKTQLPENVVFSKWKRVTLENGKKKMKVVTESLEREKFFVEWLKEVDAFNTHYNIMKTQYRQTRQLKENLPQGEIVIHMDFAENYMCKSADEIQSAYFNVTQVTLHPMVIYYKDQDGVLHHKSYVAVSDEMSHSSSTVIAIIERLFLHELDLPGCDEVNYVHYWTDSPTSQYRNRYIFHTVETHEALFGSNATWNYYEAGHGKNVCDGLGGTVKRMADDAVKSGKATIQDADDFMKWALESSMKEVVFYFVPKIDCEAMAEKVREIKFQPIKGTLKIHSVKLNENGRLLTCATSYYCTACLTGLACQTWTVHESKDIENSIPEHETVTDIKSYSKNDYVAAVYAFDSNWYVGKLVDIDPEESEVEISFMEKKKGLFQWPRREDRIWIKETAILCKLSPPEPSGKFKRLYRLSQFDLDNIEAKL